MSTRGPCKRSGTLGLLLVGGLLLAAVVPAQAQNLAPVISGNPPTTAPPLVNYWFQPTASDPDGDRLTFAASGVPTWAQFDRRTGVLSGKPPSRAIGTVNTVRILVSDGKLSSALPQFTITVAKSRTTNGAPTIGGTPAATVLEGAPYGFVPTARDPEGQALTFSIVNKPSWAAFASTSGQLSGTPPAGSAGSYPNVTISVTDGTNKTSLAPFSITVNAKPNGAPTIGGTPAATVLEGAPYGFVPTARDPEGQALTFSIVNKPSWAAFASTSGQLSGTPPVGSAGSYPNVTISVTDGTNKTSLAPFSITVNAKPNGAPTIGGTPAATVLEGAPYGFVPTARDPEGQALTFSIVNKPSWAAFASTSGQLSGTPPAGSAGSYPNVTISVTDGTNKTSLAPFSITVNAKPNGAPTIGGTPAATVLEGAPYGFVPTARDPEGQALTFSIVNKPSWAAFASTSGQLSGTPPVGSAGSYPNVTISVTDGTNKTSLAPFSITVNAKPNGAPTIGGTPAATVLEGAPYGFVPTARDPEGQALTFSIVNKPSWAAFASSSGQLSGTPPVGSAGSYPNVTISVTDGTNKVSLAPFSITVNAKPNGAPTIGGTPAATVLEGAPYGFVPTARDPEGQALTFSIVNKPSWAAFASSSGQLSGTPPVGSAGSYPNVTISVTDGTNKVSLAPFSITVNAKPNGAPTIGGTPAATVLEGAPYGFVPTARDPEGQALTFSIVNKPSWAAFASSSGQLSGTPPVGSAGSYPNVTISVTDGTNKTSLAPFSITVNAKPNGAPTIGGTPAATVLEGALYGFVPTARDPEGQALTFSIVNKPGWATFTSSSGLLSGIPPVGSAGSYPNVTISVTDGTNKTSLAPFSITVTGKANNPPAIWGIPALSVNSGEAYLFQPSASDPDGQKLQFQVQGMPGWASFNTATGALSGTPAPSHAGQYSGIVVSVTDGQASASMAPFSITVVAPNAPPTISGTPQDSVTAGQSYGFTPTARDPEGKALTFSIGNKPAWASFDATTGRLYGSPIASQAGTYSGISISTNDGQYSASLPAFSVTVLAPTPGSATVRWSPPTTNLDGTPITNLAGFRVVYGQSASNLSQSVTIPSPAITSASIEGLSTGTWYFAVKAYTTSSVESNLSPIGQKTIY